MLLQLANNTLKDSQNAGTDCMYAAARRTSFHRRFTDAIVNDINPATDVPEALRERTISLDQNFDTL